MNVKRRLEELTSELECEGIHVRLKQWPDGIEIVGNNEADRLLAQSELRKRGVIVAAPIPLSR